MTVGSKEGHATWQPTKKHDTASEDNPKEGQRHGKL
jgi:hypothetical protein